MRQRPAAGARAVALAQAASSYARRTGCSIDEADAVLGETQEASGH